MIPSEMRIFYVILSIKRDFRLFGEPLVFLILIASFYSTQKHSIIGRREYFLNVLSYQFFTETID